ncbi:MAG: hypothetical protein EG828_14975 [Deltaproteobacteria bacterium]|nr:hypothetical protein [Deltaproteobacteria bacterium]
MKNRDCFRERVLNKALTRDINEWFELEQAKKNNRQELLMTILAWLIVCLIVGLMFFAAASIRKPDVPSKQTASGEVRI